MAKYAGMTDDELAAEIARLKAEIEIRDEYFRDAEDDVIVSTIVRSTIDLLFMRILAKLTGDSGGT